MMVLVGELCPAEIRAIRYLVIHRMLAIIQEVIIREVNQWAEVSNNKC